MSENEGYSETDQALDGEYADSWGTESGLLTNYIGEVVDAWFAVNDRFGSMQLNLKNTTDNPQTQEWTESFNVGDWVSWDGGKTIENKVDKKKQKFNTQSRAGELVESLIKIGAGKEMVNRGHAYQAATYVGLRAAWGEVTKPYKMKDRTTGQEVEGVSRYNMPVEFLGFAEGSAASSSASPSTESILPTLDEALVAKLREARNASSSLHEFCDKALTIPGVQGNIPLITALADESQLWKELGE